MPVRFEGRTEYDERYMWQQSYLSHANGRPSGAVSPAGKSSIQLEYQQHYKWLDSQAATDPMQSKAAGVTSSAVTAEPPLQRRRKPQVEATSAPAQPEGGSDYFLLGNNSKFAPNIKYKIKRNAHKNVDNGTSSEVKNGESNNNRSASKGGHLSPPAAPREKSLAKKTAPPAPKVIVQTGAPQPKEEKKVIPPAPKVTVDPGAPVLRQKPVSHQSVAVETEPVGKPEPAPGKKEHRRTKSEKAHGERPKDLREVEKGIQHGVPKTGQSKKEVKQTKSEKVRAERPRDPREMAKMIQEKVAKELKGKDMMNEFAQADLDKGVLDSGQEAPANYAMKYRAGMAPARPRGPKRVSEYQMQFQWKNSANSSPLLAAEQVVYNSNPQLVPSKTEGVPKVSEYRKQFQAWPVQRSADYLSEAPNKKSKLKRSKSEESLVGDKPPAGTAPVTSAEDKRLLKESLNPQRLHFPHGRSLKNKRSEYENNFQSPSNFLYEGGAWRGAYPPHIEHRKEEGADVPDLGVEPSDSRVPSSASSSWYSEVMELRKKAEEYKKRAQGTHFSREHLAQLYAKQAELWDTASTSSILSALSLEQGSDVQHKKKKGKRAVKRPEPKDNVKKRMAWEEEEEIRSVSSRGRESSIGSIPSPAGGKGSASRSMSDTSTLVEEDVDKGRVPTPTLKQRQNQHRHHLDRTTPAVGGALLTSPPGLASSDQNMSPISVGTYSMRSDEGESSPQQVPEITKSEPAPQHSNFTKPSHPHRSRKGKVVQGSVGSVSSGSSGQPAKTRVIQSRTYGMPTRDTHVLVDEEASVDRPLRTDFVHSPEQRQAQRERPPGIPSTIREEMADTYNKPKWGLDTQPNAEDDALSTSVRSLASSCSLASEVLERARNRREEFWGH